MKRMMLAAACLLFTAMVFAQTDSSSEKTDTLTVGNFIILKKKGGNPVSENEHREPITYEYRSGRNYSGRYYRYNEFSDIPVVSRLVDQIVDAAAGIGNYFSRASYYGLSSVHYYNPKVYKVKRSNKHQRIIKINGDRYVLDKTGDRDSD